MRTSALRSTLQRVTHRTESRSAPLSEKQELCVWVCSLTTGSPESGWKKGKEEERETSSPHCHCPCFGLSSPLANKGLSVIGAPTPQSLEHWACGLLACTLSTMSSTQLPDVSGSDVLPSSTPSIGSYPKPLSTGVNFVEL